MVLLISKDHRIVALDVGRSCASGSKACLLDSSTKAPIVKETANGGMSRAKVHQLLSPMTLAAIPSGR
jgi:hypothetical protein